MTRSNYHLQDDANFPIGVENYFPVRRRAAITAKCGSTAYMPFETFGISQAVFPGVNVVTQATDKSTGVTLSKPNGNITMNAANLLAATIVSFTLTNTAIALGDTLSLNHVSGGTLGAYTLNAQCAAGSAIINVRNATAGALAEAIVISFNIVKPPFQPTFPVNGGGQASIGNTLAAVVGPLGVAQTGNASGDSASVMTDFLQTRRDMNPDVQFIVAPSSAVQGSVRHWVGLFSADPSTKADLTTATAVQAVAFGFDSVVDSGLFWSVATCDGTTQQRIALDGTGNKPAFPFLNTGIYALRIRCDTVLGIVELYGSTFSASAGFGPMVKMWTFSTNLPTATLGLGYGTTVTVLVTTPAIKKIGVGRMQLADN